MSKYQLIRRKEPEKTFESSPYLNKELDNYNSLVFYLSMDEDSGNYIDLIDNFNPTNYNVTTVNGGGNGKCGYFDGTAHLQMPQNAFYNSNFYNGSFCCWFKVISGNDYVGLMSYSSSICSNIIRLSFRDWDGMKRLFISQCHDDEDGDGIRYWNTFMTNTTDLQYDTWYFVSLIASGYVSSGWHIFINDEEEELIPVVSGNVNRGDWFADVLGAPFNLFFGCIGLSYLNLVGYMDEISLWNRAIGIAPIQDLYNYGKGRYYR